MKQLKKPFTKYKNVSMTRFLIAAFTLAATALAQAQNLTLSTPAQLAAFAQTVNEGNDYAGSNIALTADIDLADYDSWIPIGTVSKPFQGTFDGQNHRITNLKVQADAVETGFVGGLFGRIGTTGSVKDVTVSSLSVMIDDIGGYTSASCLIGAIAGRNDGTIVGCANRGVTVYGNWDNADVGGIAGYNTGTVANCYNLGRIYTGSTYANNNLGGIVGINTGKATVNNCFVRAEVVQNVSGSSRSGAICGNNLGDMASCFYMDATATDASLVLANGGDNDATISSSNGMTHQDVLLADRTLFSDGAWNTLCLPFNLPGSGNGRSPIAGATVRELDIATSGFNTTTRLLTLNFIDATDIVAGRPYIVRWDEAIPEDLSNPLFLDQTIASKDASERIVSTTDGNVDFIGQFSPLNIVAEDKSLLYLGAENLLYYPNAAMQIGTCRAYFRLRGLSEGAAGIRQLVLNFGDSEITTGIISTTLSDTTDAACAWYDLQGRKLSGKPTQRGIYVNKGRKIFIR